MRLTKRLRHKVFTDHPQVELVAWTVGSVLFLVVLSSVIFFVAHWMQSSGRYVPHRYPRNEDLSTLAAIYQGIVGAAVALAGSLVAIRIAQLGLRTTERQERRESADFLDKLIEKGIPPLIDVIVKLSELHHAFRVYQGVLMRRTWDPADEFYFRRLFGGRIDPEEPLEGEELRAAHVLNPLGRKHSLHHPDMDVHGSFAVFVKAMEGLADALEAVCKNSFSYAIWRRSVDGFEAKSFLRPLQPPDEKEYEPLHKTTPLWGVSVQRDLIEFALVLRRQAAAGRPPEMLPELMQVKEALFAMLEYNRTRGCRDPSEDTLDFLELGYTLFSEGVPDHLGLQNYPEEAAVLYQQNYGAACLLDLVSCFPAASELRAFLARQYPNVYQPGTEAAVADAVEGVDLQATLPRVFLNAKAEVSGIGGQNPECNWLFGRRAVPQPLA